MKYIGLIAAILLIIGGLNWGLVAFFDFNIVGWLLGDTLLAKAVYGLVALSAIYEIVTWKQSHA